MPFSVIAEIVTSVGSAIAEGAAAVGTAVGSAATAVGGAIGDAAGAIGSAVGVGGAAAGTDAASLAAADTAGGLIPGVVGADAVSGVGGTLGSVGAGAGAGLADTAALTAADTAAGLNPAVVGADSVSGVGGTVPAAGAAPGVSGAAPGVAGAGAGGPIPGTPPPPPSIDAPPPLTPGTPPPAVPPGGAPPPALSGPPPATPDVTAPPGTPATAPSAPPTSVAPTPPGNVPGPPPGGAFGPNSALTALNNANAPALADAPVESPGFLSNLASGNFSAAGSQALTAVGNNPGLALSGAGVALEALKSQQTLPGQGEIAEQAGNLGAQGAKLASFLNKGTLPPGVQASLNEAQAQAIASIKSQYASRGESGSSAEAQDIANAQLAVHTQGVQIAENLLQTGINEENLSSQLYNEILQFQLGQDTALGGAITGFAIASAGGIPRQTTQVQQAA